MQIDKRLESDREINEMDGWWMNVQIEKQLTEKHDTILHAALNPTPADVYSKNPSDIRSMIGGLNILSKDPLSCRNMGRIVGEIFVFASCSPITSFWVNYNNSLTWIKAIWGWFPLLTMISSELVVSSL